MIKLFKYRTAGVREYWIVDSLKNRITVYNFEEDTMQEYTFSEDIPAGIYQGKLTINLFKYSEISVEYMIYSGTYIVIKADVPEFFRRLKIVIIYKKYLYAYDSL